MSVRYLLLFLLLASNFSLYGKYPQGNSAPEVQANGIINHCFEKENKSSTAASQESLNRSWFVSSDSIEFSYEWKASWIWTSPKDSKRMMLARKEFTLDAEIEQAELRITASDLYRLYVNGTYICRGPARSAPHHQSYDILDIADLLVPGKNVIAVKVHQRDTRRAYQFESRAGLLAQLDLHVGDGILHIKTDKTWKVLPDPSWSDDAPKISRFQDFVNDRVDLRAYCVGWEKLAYDDSDWQKANELKRNVDWPAPQKNDRTHALIPPWTKLVPRDIPYLEENDRRAELLMVDINIQDIQKGNKVVGIDSIELDEINRKGDRVYRKAVSGDKPFVVAKNEIGESRVLLFDFGEIVIGMPKLEIEGAQGTVVDIMSAPYMLNDVFTHEIVNATGLDRIILSGRQDNWEATYFKPTRYMAVVIRNNPEKLLLHFVGIHQINYPFVSKGKVSAPGSEWVERYWAASEKTLDVCTTDGFTDNYRERRQYAQTGYYAALGAYWTFGDYALQRRYLIQVAQEQQANGIMPAYAPLPGGDYMVIFDSNCLWMRSLRNYLFYSGDKESVRALLPAAKRLMALFQSYVNEKGLLNNPPYSYWLDHALQDRRGANFTLNAHYLGALEDFEEVLAYFGDSQEAIYGQRADLLRQSLHDLFWDSERELFVDAYVDGEKSKAFSEHSNAMALAMHVADAEQEELIAAELLKKDDHNFIFRESGITMVTPAMSYFLHKGLCEANEVEASLDMFRGRFDHMLDPETNGTLMEEWFIDGSGRTGKLQKKTRSDAQTESAFPPALIVEYVFGISVLSPGMEEVGIRYYDSGIKKIEGSFPCPQGILDVAWDNAGETGTLELSIPEGMMVELDFGSFIGSEGFLLNGIEPDFNRETMKKKLGSGVYTLQF